MEPFAYANKGEQIKKINKYMSTSMIIFDALIMLVVVISVIQGNRTLGYACMLGFVMLATIITCLVMVARNPGSSRLW